MHQRFATSYHANYTLLYASIIIFCQLCVGMNFALFMGYLYPDFRLREPFQSHSEVASCTPYCVGLHQMMPKRNCLQCVIQEPLFRSLFYVEIFAVSISSLQQIASCNFSLVRKQIFNIWRPLKLGQLFHNIYIVLTHPVTVRFRRREHIVKMCMP